MLENRDKIAIEAMKELLKHFSFSEFANDPMRVACWSYDMADAMLLARTLPPNEFTGFFAEDREDK